MINIRILIYYTVEDWCIFYYKDFEVPFVPKYGMSVEEGDLEYDFITNTQQITRISYDLEAKIFRVSIDFNNHRFKDFYEVKHILKQFQVYSWIEQSLEIDGLEWHMENIQK